MKYITIDGFTYGVGEIVHVRTVGDMRGLGGLYAPLQIFVVRENEELDSLELCRVSAGALRVLHAEAYEKILDRLSNRE